MNINELLVLLFNLVNVQAHLYVIQKCVGYRGQLKRETESF
jgi:hypothetical protein